jgi:hypothetical protein
MFGGGLPGLTKHLSGMSNIAQSGKVGFNRTKARP